MLWVDKYRPKTLDEAELLPEPTNALRTLAGTNDMPHLLVYGPPGGGKRTRVMGLLAQQFGPTVYNVKLDHKAVQVTESKSIEIATLSSPHHIDINPSDAGNYDRVIVMQMIREIASTVPLVTSNALGKGGAAQAGPSRPPFKVIVMNEVDKLSRGAQQALRRTMEKYVATCRLILICSSASRLIQPLRSRCLAVRVPLHSEASIASVARSICNAEHVSPPPSDAFCTSLFVRSEGNLRRAILMLEAAKMNRADLAGSGDDIPMPDWKFYVTEIASNITTEQTPRMLYEVRGKFYELLAQCIPGDMILRELVLTLLALAPPAARREILAAAALFDVNMKMGSKPIMHLEAFTAAAMKAIKSVRL